MWPRRLWWSSEEMDQLRAKERLSEMVEKTLTRMKSSGPWLRVSSSLKFRDEWVSETGWAGSIGVACVKLMITGGWLQYHTGIYSTYMYNTCLEPEEPRPTTMICFTVPTQTQVQLTKVNTLGASLWPRRMGVPSLSLTGLGVPLSLCLSQ